MRTSLAALVEVNDVHSQLNRTQMQQIARPRTGAELKRAVQDSTKISVAGGKHAMGGQQFATNGTLIDTRTLNRILHFDQEQGIVEVEAGIQWPQLVNWLQPRRWGIRQKQTGADR